MMWFLKSLYFISVLADQHWHVRMVDHKVTDTAQECSPEGAMPTTATDNYGGMVFLRCVHDCLPWQTYGSL